MAIYKTTIEIYTHNNPKGNYESIEDLAREATSGYAVCDRQETVKVKKEDVPEGVLSFFNIAME